MVCASLAISVIHACSLRTCLPKGQPRSICKFVAGTAALALTHLHWCARRRRVWNEHEERLRGEPGKQMQPDSAAFHAVMRHVISILEIELCMRQCAKYLWAQVAFYSTTVATFAVATGLMIAIVLFARWKRLLFIPDAQNAGRK